VAPRREAAVRGAAPPQRRGRHAALRARGGAGRQVSKGDTANLLSTGVLFYTFGKVRDSPGRVCH
jgi:hypothetical protein